VFQQLFYCLAQTSSSAKCTDFNFRFGPPGHFRDILDRNLFAVDRHHNQAVLGGEFVEYLLGQIGGVAAAFARLKPVGGITGHLIVQPGLIAVCKIRYRRLWASLCASQHIDTLIRGDSCQPPFQRTSPFEARKLGVRFEKSLLGGVFDRSLLMKETAGDSENLRAVSTKNFLKRALVAVAREVYQFKIRSLFDLD